MQVKSEDPELAFWVAKFAKDFCQDPETGLLCGSEPGAGGESDGGGPVASPAEAAKEVARVSMERPGVPAQDQRDLRRYIENAYGFQINQALRGQSSDAKALETGKVVIKAYEKHALPINKNLTLFRGIKANLANLKPGDTFVDKGIVSTSASKNWATKFKGKDTPLIEIHVPKGTKVLGGRIDSMEKEMVLHPGSKFKVISSSKKVIVVELQ
jgi:hypothetical protein